MSSKVNSTAIGAFLMGALVLVIAAVLYFGGGAFGNSEDRREAIVLFTGSVKGLNVGAPVTLRGVKIGEVTEIDVSWDPKMREFVIPVSVSVNGRDLSQGDAPVFPGESFLQPLIERGMRAQLKTVSLLTGLLYIDLDFLPGSKARYVDFDTAVPQIPTAPTELEAILQRVSSIDIQAFVQHADDVLKALDGLLENPETQSIPANINATLAEVRTLTKSIDSEVATLSARVDALAVSADGAIGDARAEVASLGRRIDGTLDTLDATLGSVRGTADTINYTASEQSPLVFELSRAVAELGRAGRSLQALADSLEREPEALFRGKSADKEE